MYLFVHSSIFLPPVFFLLSLQKVIGGSSFFFSYMHYKCHPFYRAGYLGLNFKLCLKDPGGTLTPRYNPNTGISPTQNLTAYNGIGKF